jgi:group I intron endonuclease
MNDIEIYCHLSPSGKAYVGQSVDSIKRWRKHVGCAMRGGSDCDALYKAIRKYGGSAFEHVILETVCGHDAANEAERRWVALLNCRVPNGYNLAYGGGCGPMHADTRAKIGAAVRASAARKGPEQRRGEWRRTPEQIERLRDNMRRISLAQDTDVRAQNGRRNIVGVLAGYTAEKRAAASKKRLASTTPDGRSESGRMAYAGMSDEARKVRNERIGAATKARMADMPANERSAMARSAGLASWANKTDAEREEVVAQLRGSVTPEQRRINSGKMWAGLTAQERSALFRSTHSEDQLKEANIKRLASTTHESRSAAAKKMWVTRRRRKMSSERAEMPL